MMEPDPVGPTALAITAIYATATNAKTTAPRESGFTAGIATAAAKANSNAPKRKRFMNTRSQSCKRAGKPSPENWPGWKKESGKKRKFNNEDRDTSQRR